MPPCLSAPSPSLGKQHQMKLLRSLAPIGAHHHLTITPIYNGDAVTVTISFRPTGKSDKDDEAAKPRQPINISGSIEEVDDYLTEVLNVHATQVSTLISNLDAVKAEVEAEVAAAKAKPVASAPVASAKKGAAHKKGAAKSIDAPKPPPPRAPAPTGGQTPPSASLLKPSWVEPSDTVTAVSGPIGTFNADPKDVVDLSFLD